MDLGSGHELCILSDGITIKLFRNIAISEVCGVHWFNGDLNQPELEERRRDSHVDEKFPAMVQGAHKAPGSLHPNVSRSDSSKMDVVRDKISRVVSRDTQDDPSPRDAPGATTEDREPPDERMRSKKLKAAMSRNDLEADERYNHALDELRRTNRVYQSHQRVKKARRESTSEFNERTELRHTVCADLRTTKNPQSSTSGEIALTRLMEIFTPISWILDKVPIVLRLMLWMLTQSHAISCPSVCFTAAGPFLGGAVLDRLFRHHATEDKRIKQLKREVSAWLCAANIYVEFQDLTARSSVPLLTSNVITCDFRSTGVVISRIGADVTNSGQAVSYTHLTLPTKRIV